METQKAVHKTRLHFKEVSSIPHLKMAEGLKAPSGPELIAFSWHKNSLHIVADGSIRGFGGITVIGPSVTTAALDWGKIIDIAFDLGHKIFGDGGDGGDGGGGGGGSGQKCTMTIEVGTDAQGHVTSMGGKMTCTPA